MNDYCAVADRYAIRRLTADDAADIAAVHIRVWRETYPGLMAQAALDALDVERITVKWRQILGGDDSPRVVGAIERATGALAGWITVGQARDEDAPAPTELWVLKPRSRAPGDGRCPGTHEARAGGSARLPVGGRGQ